jgi:Tol biopolymer transport system component
MTDDEANEVPTAWTPDSKAILFDSNRNGTPQILKQEISQETAEAVITGSQLGPGPARLSTDGAWILYLEAPTTSIGPSTPLRLMRVPVAGGVPKFVLETRSNEDFGCARAPAHLCCLVEASPDGKQVTLTAFDPLQGRGKVLRTIPQEPTAPFVETALSPDGSTFAVSRRAEAEIHIQLLSLSGGLDRQITVKHWANLTGLDWSPDGKGLYLGAGSPKRSALLYVDLKGNPQVLCQSKTGGDTWGIASPDGRYLAIMGVASQSNLWMLEGF